MNLLLVFNFLVLSGLVLFFIREERRFRSFSKRVSETKADLTSIVHQLRSPLSNLRKYNEFLQSKEFGTLSFAQQEAINKVQSSLSASIVLLNRLLARSRLDEEKIMTQPAELNLRDIVQGAVSAIAPAAHGKHQEIMIEGEDGVEVFADALLLHGILDEILLNAVHYTHDGGKMSIWISDAGNVGQVAIKDTGIGITSAEKPFIFQKFFRGERAKAMAAGNGLGLSFAKLFTERMGGTIQFSSTEGKGTILTVTLPKKGERTLVK